MHRRDMARHQHQHRVLLAQRRISLSCASQQRLESWRWRA